MGFKTRAKGGERWRSGDMRWKTVPQTKRTQQQTQAVTDCRTGLDTIMINQFS